jgi:hypothetical protein
MIVENDIRGASRAGLVAALVDREGRAPGDLPRYPGLGAIVDAILAGRPA